MDPCRRWRRWTIAVLWGTLVWLPVGWAVGRGCRGAAQGLAETGAPSEPDGAAKADSPLVSPLTDDPRSTILLRYGCRSGAGRREVTLFADGTVRLRKVEAPGHERETEGVEPSVAGTGKEVMELYELDPDSLAAYRARLADEDLSEVDLERNPVDGEWVEACRLDLLRPPDELHYRFSRYSALPLALSRVVKIADDLSAEVDAAPKNHLPDDYEARRGDVLERTDGVLFEVVDFTADGKGVELSGVEAPLVLYLPPDALRQRFVRVVSREHGPGIGGGSGGGPGGPGNRPR